MDNESTGALLFFGIPLAIAGLFFCFGVLVLIFYLLPIILFITFLTLRKHWWNLIVISPSFLGLYFMFNHFQPLKKYEFELFNWDLSWFYDVINFFVQIYPILTAVSFATALILILIARRNEREAVIRRIRDESYNQRQRQRAAEIAEVHAAAPVINQVYPQQREAVIERNVEAPRPNNRTIANNQVHNQNLQRNNRRHLSSDAYDTEPIISRNYPDN